MNLLRISKVDKAEGFPLKGKTLYKWWHLQKHTEIFIKIGGALFVDTDKFYELAAAGKLSASTR